MQEKNDPHLFHLHPRLSKSVTTIFELSLNNIAIRKTMVTTWQGYFKRKYCIYFKKCLPSLDSIFFSDNHDNRYY